MKKKKDEVGRYLQKAADLGNVDSMVKLSEILQVGNNLSQEDYDNVYKYAKMAIENGSDKSIYWITELLDNNKIKKENHQEVFNILKKEADSGCSYAMLAYGFHKRNPIYFENTQENINEALHYLKMAADNGNENAKFALGNYYFDEDEKSKEAIKFYKMAADHGFVNSMAKVAAILQD